MAGFDFKIMTDLAAAGYTPEQIAQLFAIFECRRHPDEAIRSWRQRHAKPERAAREPAERGTRLTVDAVPEPHRTRIAVAAGMTAVEVAGTWAEFFNYWTSLPGTRSRKLDWLKTWDNRCREVIGRSKSRPGVPAAYNKPADPNAYVPKAPKWQPSERLLAVIAANEGKARGET